MSKLCNALSPTPTCMWYQSLTRLSPLMQQKHHNHLVLNTKYSITSLDINIHTTHDAWTYDTLWTCSTTKFTINFTFILHTCIHPQYHQHLYAINSTISTSLSPQIHTSRNEQSFNYVIHLKKTNTNHIIVFTISNTKH